jgi:hypothetical protein
MDTQDAGMSKRMDYRESALWGYVMGALTGFILGVLAAAAAGCATPSESLSPEERARETLRDPFVEVRVLSVRGLERTQDPDVQKRLVPFQEAQGWFCMPPDSFSRLLNSCSSP